MQNSIQSHKYQERIVYTETDMTYIGGGRYVVPGTGSTSGRTYRLIFEETQRLMLTDVALRPEQEPKQLPAYMSITWSKDGEEEVTFFDDPVDDDFKLQNSDGRYTEVYRRQVNEDGSEGYRLAW